MEFDYIPKADQAFEAWQVNFLAYLAANAAMLGFSAADVTALTDSQTDWVKAIQAHVRLHAEARAAFAGKQAARKSFATLIRSAARRVQARTKTTDEERRRLGITVRDAIRSAAPPPVTRPLVQVVMGERLQHRVRIFNEGDTVRRAKPRGVMGAELFVALADARELPPPDPAIYRYVSLVTASTALVEFAGPDAGRTAHYIARWISTRGAKGPWSETVSATVGA